jgi:hypothetical protein
MIERPHLSERDQRPSAAAAAEQDACLLSRAVRSALLTIHEIFAADTEAAP